MIWVVWFAALLFVFIVGVFVMACCAAAKRGDQMTESCPEFDAHWREPRP